MTSFVLTVMMLLASAEPYALEPRAAFHEPNAVLLNVSEQDLNRIVRGAFREHIGTNVAGTSSRPSSGIQDLSYEATFSEPVLRLDDHGGARLDLDLVEARLRIGRFEKKFLRRMASCDGAGLNVDPDRPVEVAVHMSFEVDDHDLQIVPSSVTVEDAKSFRLIKPTTCRNTWLPKWLVWRIGKGQLRKKIKRLDDTLLAKAQSEAAGLSQDSGLLTQRWRVGSEDLLLYPQGIDTSHGSLLVGFAVSERPLPETTPGMPGWVANESHRSYLGLSESFLNAAARSAVERLRTRPREPSGNLAKLFRGTAVHSLIPGLRDVRAEHLRLGLAIHEAPRIGFEALQPETTDAGTTRALIRVRLSNAELTFWESEKLLGALKIESARLAVAPYRNRIGGISFDIVENAWDLSSRDMDFDEETLAAIFQELFFGEMFETRYQPIAQDALDLGGTPFQPRYFNLLGRYLVIGLSEF